MMDGYEEVFTVKKLFHALGLPLACLLLGFAFAQSAGQQQALTRSSKQPIFLKFQDVKWKKAATPQGDCTYEVAQLRVDPQTQAIQMLIRGAANCHVPRPWHTASEAITVISGTFILECNGRREALTPGSFAYVPSQTVHEVWTKPDEGSLSFVTMDGPMDAHWLDSPAQTPKKP